MANLLVIVSYSIFPAHMGGQKGIALFYQSLKNYHSVYMVLSTDNHPAEVAYDTELLLQNHSRMAANLLCLPKLRKRIRDKEIQCIIAEHSYTAWLAWLLKLTTGVPFIIHSHNNEASRFRQMGRKGWKLYGYYEKWIHRKASFSFFKTEKEKEHAIRSYGLNRQQCAVIPYGTKPVKIIKNAKNECRTLYNIQSRYLFYFNGTLDYTPNKLAVEDLIENIYPLLLTAGIDFTILISGKNLSPQLQQKIHACPAIRYLGFVADPSLLYQASDLFVNPVRNDSGVKTKVVEALANHCTVVSTDAGASGIPEAFHLRKLLTAPDGDWKGFVNKIIFSLQNPADETYPSFFTYFAWENIAARAAGYIDTTINYGAKKL